MDFLHQITARLTPSATPPQLAGMASSAREWGTELLRHTLNSGIVSADWMQLVNQMVLPPVTSHSEAFSICRFRVSDRNQFSSSSADPVGGKARVKRRRWRDDDLVFLDHCGNGMESSLPREAAGRPAGSGIVEHRKTNEQMSLSADLLLFAAMVESPTR
ncbi:uncharacterized protein MYCGRDRAFT_96020 [Zymoseptoria tritici IPO323]|uniref:Uncharacterized protein n=1 Tax=Zymoseptoria tritici (strain CBS 115943 / IPO323) TaxID=336722 RepID=F9XKL3_ZYMTI|nr:uncharacterized protein MYCGRDRAFT_96020 [Zymoseptoria tritici IPO323]EGP84214.1 hypothetical protein MYCGRDRAFT_96020 [Zymoseptoria tritici IPO323]